MTVKELETHVASLTTQLATLATSVQELIHERQDQRRTNETILQTLQTLMTTHPEQRLIPNPQGAIIQGKTLHIDFPKFTGDDPEGWAGVRLLHPMSLTHAFDLTLCQEDAINATTAYYAAKGSFQSSLRTIAAQSASKPTASTATLPPGGVCYMEKGVLVTVYVERPRRRRVSSNNNDPFKQRLRQYRKGIVAGRGFDRRAELLHYSHSLRLSARLAASTPIPPIPTASNTHQPITKVQKKWGFVSKLFSKLRKQR
ncbi:hypothetical protein HHK36_028620 [Tetracentron sinense]|uniref:Uncharacterized protein n=1 Tax=Tetracentron sinense TaxID=13715 RepID=A0A834YBQ4_TETSI|nr:hypothetical protein HHK36_028620 [Tetracentron sinense]